MILLQVELTDFKWLLKTMLTAEISLEILKKDSLTSHSIFSGKEWGSTESGVERGAEYFKILRRRVMEMNARVISKYYKRIRLERMSVLLAVGRDELEKILSDMVSENALYCKIDRPMGIVSFVKNQRAFVFQGKPALSTPDRRSGFPEKQRAIFPEDRLFFTDLSHGVVQSVHFT